MLLTPIAGQNMFFNIFHEKIMKEGRNSKKIEAEFGEKQFTLIF